MAPVRGRVALLSALVSLALAPLARANDTAHVEGRVRLDVPGAALEVVGPVVVFLDADVAFAPPRGVAEIRQQNARFSPSFLAIAAGQTVDMPNFDGIYHNAFSFSRPNDFDLGTYPSGESRSITFTAPGIVKIYCSIHERMSATVFVAPTPWFAVADPSGRFVIDGVPAGRYVLRTWAERLPATERRVALGLGETLEVDLPIVARTD